MILILWQYSSQIFFQGNTVYDIGPILCAILTAWRPASNAMLVNAGENEP
jgi:hypothetical protein